MTRDEEKRRKRQRERELIARSLEGDGHAFDELVELNERIVSGLCGKILLNHEDVRDACQAAWIRAFNSLARFEPREQFSAWVCKIAKNECLRLLKRRHRLLDVVREYEESVSGVQEDPSEGLETILVWRTIEETVHERLEGLNRRIYIARIRLGLTFEEIAEPLKITVSAVKLRWVRRRRDFSYARSCIMYTIVNVAYAYGIPLPADAMATVTGVGGSARVSRRRIRREETT